MAPLRETNERAWPAESRPKVGAAPLRSGPQTARRPGPAGWGAVAFGAAAPPGAPRFLEAGCARCNRDCEVGRGLHQPPRVGLSAGEEAAVPPPPPPWKSTAARRYPPPSPPPADSRPARPSGQAPSRPAPAPAGSPSGLGFGVRGAAWGWRPGLLGPCPHLWPPAPAL